MTKMGAFVCVFVSLATESNVLSSIENEWRKQLLYFGCFGCCCCCCCYHWYYQMVFGVCIVENCKLCLSLQPLHKVYNCKSNKSDQITCMGACVWVSCVSFGCHFIWIKYLNDLHIQCVCGCARNVVALEIGLPTKYRWAILLAWAHQTKIKDVGVVKRARISTMMARLLR